MARYPEREQTPDSAAVFTAALSIWEAFTNSNSGEHAPNLSDSYNGMDQFMREIMRVANLFESWSCSNVVFEELNECWPYYLHDKFGSACLAILGSENLTEFDESDCLRVAMCLRLPMKPDRNPRVPVDITAINPVQGSSFRQFRIQTVRFSDDGETIVPYTWDDEPFELDYGPPHFGLYGIGENGLVEHIADRDSYSDAVSLAQKLAPNIAFPAVPLPPSYPVATS